MGERRERVEEGERIKVRGEKREEKREKRKERRKEEK